MLTPVQRNALDVKPLITDRRHDFTDQTTLVIQVDVAMRTAGGIANKTWLKCEAESEPSRINSHIPFTIRL